MKRNIIKAYRVGDIEWGRGAFFAESPEYYDHSQTGYSKKDATEYEIDLTEAKVFDPMKEWKVYANTWGDLRQSCDFFKKRDFDYYEEVGENEAMTCTDDMAAWAREKGYDAVIFREIPSDYGYGPCFTEYCIFNKKLINQGEQK